MNDESPYPISNSERFYIEPRHVYDLALLGYCEHTNRVVYSRELLIQCIVNNALSEIEAMNREENTNDEENIELDKNTIYEEAETFYIEQIAGVWLGECNPIFVSTQKLAVN